MYCIVIIDMFLFRGSEDMFCWVSRVVDSICKYKHKLDNRYIPQVAQIKSLLYNCTVCNNYL